MLSLAFLAWALVAGRCFAQDDAPSNIPPEEAEALENIVEDDAGGVFKVLKDWESPEYNLIYRVPLPIPPVKQPKMCVNPSMFSRGPLS